MPQEPPQLRQDHLPVPAEIGVMTQSHQDLIPGTPIGRYPTGDLQQVGYVWDAAAGPSLLCMGSENPAERYGEARVD
jgi:hypothetical protein